MLCMRESVPAIESIAARGEWLASLAGDRLGLMLLGDACYGETEIARATGLPVFGRLPRDPRAVPALHGGAGPSPARSHLVRAARTLCDSVIGRRVGAPA
jgi:hypothetical protein